MRQDDLARLTEDKPERTLEGARSCAYWLTACLRLGWSRADLDRLEALWWEYHDETGTAVEK